MNSSPRFVSFQSILLAIFLAVVSVAAPAAAGEGRWTAFGPGGGTVRSLAVDPSDPDTLYAVTGGGVYKTADGGGTWTWVALPSSCCVGAVAVDPARPSRVLAGVRGSLELSEDRGRTWTEVLSGEGLFVEALAFAPGTPSTAFLSDTGRLLWSRDGGRTWAPAALGRTGVRGVEVDPRNPRTVYAVLFNGVSRSVDGGASWTALPMPVPPGRLSGPEDLRAMAVAPSGPPKLYVAGAQGFYRSRDGGRSWVSLPRFLGPDEGVLRLVADPVVPGTLYAATDRGVWASHDSGNSWQAINLGLPLNDRGYLSVQALAVHPLHPEILWAGIAEPYEVQDLGVARTANGGRLWTLGLQRGLSAARFGFIKSPAPGVHYTALNPIASEVSCARGLKSTDGGRTWSPFAEAIAHQGLKDLAFEPDDPNVLYAGTKRAVWKSLDGGTHWRRLIRTEGYLLATAGRGTVLAAGVCGLRRSADGGRTWRSALGCTVPAGDPSDPGRLKTLIFRRLATEPGNPARVYAEVLELYSGEGDALVWIYLSADGGAHWRALTPGELVTVSPSRPATLYAQRVTDSGTELLRSDDRGVSWHRAALLELPLADLAIDPRSAEVLYGAVPGRGVLRSTDGGATWESANAGLARMGRFDVRAVVADPWQPGRLFALPWEGGGLFAQRFPEP